VIERSQHPADRLIRELIQTGRPATTEEIDQIVERMATAPFASRLVRVRQELRGIEFEGEVFGARAESLRYHLAERILVNRQWVAGTTAAQYVEDLRHAVRHSRARLVVFERRGGPMAAVLVSNMVPASRLGSRALLWIFVVYSADRGTIVSGYQASGLSTISIPEDARWLK
jgi:hypothetical protein